LPSRQIGFLAELVIQRISCFEVRGDAVLVVDVVPTSTVVTGFVRTVEELVGSFVEVVVGLVGNDKFDRCGSPDLYISGAVLTVISSLGVRLLLSRGLRHSMSASSPVHSQREFDQSEPLAA